jgi:hypothetical protein
MRKILILIPILIMSQGCMAAAIGYGAYKYGEAQESQAKAHEQTMEVEKTKLAILNRQVEIEQARRK